MLPGQSGDRQRATAAVEDLSSLSLRTLADTGGSCGRASRTVDRTDRLEDTEGPGADTDDPAAAGNDAGANAFNTFSHDEMMKQILARCPSLARYTWFPYCNFSKLWSSGANPDEPPVLSCAGVRREDPLGPLLFAMVLNPALEHLATHHADTPCAAYVDDIVLQGKPEEVCHAFSALKERCAHVGLQVNDAKCHAYSLSHEAAQSVSSATGDTRALRVLGVAGTPLGEDEFVREIAAGKAEEAQCAVATLLTLP